MNTKKDDFFISLFIAIGILAVVVIYVICNGKYTEDNRYNKLLEDYGIIREDKDRQDMLIYDKETKIVYKCKYEGSVYGEGFNIQSYFASNGLPYRYNEETKEIEIIPIN